MLNGIEAKTVVAEQVKEEGRPTNDVSHTADTESITQQAQNSVIVS